MSSDLRTQLERRRDAALRLPPLEHLPGDVRDPDTRPSKPPTFTLNDWRAWWRESDPLKRTHIEAMAQAEGVYQ